MALVYDPKLGTWVETENSMGPTAVGADVPISKSIVDEYPQSSISNEPDISSLLKSIKSKVPTIDLDSYSRKINEGIVNRNNITGDMRDFPENYPFLDYNIFGKKEQNTINNMPDSQKDAYDISNLLKGIPGLDSNLIMNQDIGKLEQWTPGVGAIPSPFPTPAPTRGSVADASIPTYGSVMSKDKAAPATSPSPLTSDIPQAPTQDDELIAAQNMRQNTVNSNAMLRAVNNITQALARQKKDDSFLTDIDKNAENLPADVLARRKEEREKGRYQLDTERGKIDLEKARIQLTDMKAMDDPNSDVSKTYREATRARFAMIGKKANIPDNMNGSTVSKLYPTTDIVDDFIKLKGIEERMALVKATKSEKLDAKDHQRLDQANKLIQSDIARNNTAFGRNANIIRSADAIEALVAGKNPNDITPQQIYEVAKNLDAMLSSGAATVQGTQKLIPQGINMKTATLQEFLTNSPSPAKQKAYVLQTMDTIKRERDLARDKIQNASRGMLSSYQDLAKKQPEAWNAMLQLNNLDPNILSLDKPQKSNESDNVKVRLPDGRTGLIPRANLEKAKAAGAKEI